MFNTIAHCTTFYYYAQVLRYIADMRPPPGREADPTMLNFLDSRTKYFTMWGLAAQTLLFLLCVMHDVTRLLRPANPLRHAARSLRDLFFVAVAAPWAVTVSAMFWALFFVDRELVLPASLDVMVPSWLNHSMHSVVLLLAAAQLLAEPHEPPCLRSVLAVSGVLNIAYVYTLFNEYATTGRWLYPVFAVLDWPGRVALVLFTSALTLSQAALIRGIVKARWGSIHADTIVMKKRKD